MSMQDVDKRLFVGIKISPALERELEKCPRDAEHYFKDHNPASLEIMTLGAERFIGRFLQDGFPVSNIENVSRNVRSIITLITRGHRLTEDAIRIYADPKFSVALSV